VEWIYLLLIFFAVGLSIVTGYLVVTDLSQRDQRLATRRVEELSKDVSAAPQAPVLFKSADELDLGELARGEPSRPEPALLGELLRRDWLRPLRESLRRSGLAIGLNRVLCVSAVLALVLGAAGLWCQGPLLALPAFLAGVAAPLIYVERAGRGRRERFLAQLSGAFELMARILRSGQSVPQAFQAVADSFEEPLASAFSRCREQQNMGLPPEIAFQELAEESGVLEMRIFGMAMLVQRQVGGNLSEILERLAALVRERRRIRMQIRTLTAEGRLQAAILLVLPFFMFAVLRFINRDYADELLRHPSLLGATLFIMGIGALWIRKIISFEV
jgi:tight adherence protein B